MSEERGEAITRLIRGVLGLLLIVFVILKLAGVVSWSWWIVTAPFWIPAAISLSALTLASILRAISDLLRFRS